MQPSQLLSFSAQAQYFRYALGVGLVRVADIIDWATQQSAHRAHRPERAETQADAAKREVLLNQLAKGSQLAPSDILAMLARLAGREEDDSTWRAIKQQVCLQLSAGNMQARSVVSYFYNLALSGEIPASDRETLYQLELEYDSLLQGFASVEDIDREALAFFQKQ